MCVIVHKPAGVVLDEETLAECFKKNSDGAGVAYVDPKRGLVIDKGYFKFKPFYKKLCQLMQQELLIHFRVTSRGEISVKNCHPFGWRSKELPQYTFAIAHNGTFDWRSTVAHSDTACFISDLLGPHLDRDPYFLDTHTGMTLLERAISSRNKLCILRHDSETGELRHYIVNKHIGTEDLGCWFSNTTYKKWTTSHVVDYPGYYGSQGSLGFGADDEMSVFGWNYQRDGRWRRPTVARKRTVMDRIMEAHQGRIVPIELAPPSTPSVVPSEDKKTEQPAETNGGSDKDFEEFNQGQGGDSHVDLQPADDPDHPVAISAINLEHLGRLEKKALRRMAYEFCKWQKLDLRKLRPGEPVTRFRAFVRDILDKRTMQMTSSELDRWILVQNEYCLWGDRAGQRFSEPTPI
jgi:hypothetical protein